jgi:hypothetical protein
MIPYVIRQAYPCGDNLMENAVESFFGCSEKDKINESIINEITKKMAEWYDERMEYHEYEYQVTISSYTDFCEQYLEAMKEEKWEELELEQPIYCEWKNAFRVCYFDDEWIEWNVEDYREQIYISYMNTYPGKTGL